MQHFPVFTISILLLLLACATHAHNITRILAKHPEFSTFNHYLTVTHLAGEINRRQTITVLAVDNAGMSDLLAKRLSVYALKNVLSLHVLVDYFGAKKLHQINNRTALSATMFQATGAASGTAGFINITDLKGGKVGFGSEDNNGNLDAVFVKSLEEVPYNISVLQISHIINSAEAEAPTAEPSQLNLTTIMLKQGCKAFADLLMASGAKKTFDQNIDGGLTVFCPSDDVINGFAAKYKNLTAKGKEALLLYHGVPVYQSMQMLKSNNGAMNTLATDGANKYDFTVQNDGEEVTLETKVVTARVTGTLIDEEPLVVYKINKILLPRELFKAAPAASPAKAASPKAAAADSSEADSPESDPADQTADQNRAIGFDGEKVVGTVLLSLCLGLLFV
ncbi:hypothetical protein L1049_023453 [Liquidambar formosana]|uniref:FAS1 domain-containing protein n=1 Tax=Liquidambar formosana TaxID=63359 RepID=A0AAP0RSW7_LIQFO